MQFTTRDFPLAIAAALALALLAGCESPPTDGPAPAPEEQVGTQEATDGAEAAPEGPREWDPTQSTFATPEEALEALVNACRDDDDAAMLDVVGHAFEHVVVREDKAESRLDRQEMVEAADARVRLDRESEDHVIALLGADAWPLPIPIVRVDGLWRFDTAAGAEEILNRRIGEHELETIATLHALVTAQVRYAAVDRDADRVREYAQHFNSSPGERDGLYWEVEEGEELSPVGPLLAEAEEYADERESGDAWMGYHYRMLLAQGAAAPGGAYHYVINDNMIAGFAFVAYPAGYGSSGIMTFIVSHQGQVHEADLGEDTAALASAMEAYDPDDSWEPVTDE